MGDHTPADCAVHCIRVEKECGCRPQAIIGGTVEVIHCALHGAAQNLLDACREAVVIIHDLTDYEPGTGNDIDYAESIQAAIAKATKAE